MVSPQWAIRLLFCEKALSQWLHQYRFSQVYVPWCNLGHHLIEKLLPHWMHQYGFSPWCVPIWVMRWLFCKKSLVTLAALMCFFPNVCSNMDYKSHLLWKSLVIFVAMVRFLPTMCSHMVYKMTILWFFLTHWLHWYVFSPMCILIWITSVLFSEQAWEPSLALS